ncbi:MAG: hypothetical protein NC420_09885 [Eubacterium sp.]|nr:hypothetical protein [Eubacterium sp.]MCM1216305.1 hypothetical protein [Lachnospiraceae bacterium]MCM1240072.1 hypothetical protein [Lachnospiraceae bacterium]MCM1410485.1 hypothetical protein [Lachnospiraceae bacterium]
MGEYVKPVVVTMNEKAEGVFAASGAAEGEVRCRFGFTDCNPGRDTCQACSASGGTQSEGKNYQEDFAGCPDGMPLKQ